MLSSILTMDGRLLDATNPQWLHWLRETPSTNTWAIANAAHLHHGDVVFTQHQTAGRGQGDRVWYSPAGVLTASFVLDGIPPAQWPGLSLASGLAVIYAIEDLMPTCQNMLRLKWPNDVWYDRRKLAGILCEGAGSRVIVGVGCNRQVDLAELTALGNAISLHQIQRIVPTEMSLLERLRHYLLEVAGLLTVDTAPGLSPLLPALRERDGLQGQAVHLAIHKRQWSGIARGIDEQGRLQIQDAQGEVHAFAAGRVSLAGA
jgi:BirA family biotin operon repressor/biotin-[acetyl-CoA-carboxylase] ligase